MISTKNKNKEVVQIFKQNSKNILLITIVLIFSLLGVHYLISSHASSPNVSINADIGVLSDVATVISDNNASNGHAVKFGTTLALHVSNGQIVDGNSKTIRLLGADITSTESYCLTHNAFSFGALDQSEANGIKSWKINAVRIPLNEDCWLGINGAPAAYSGVNYQNTIKNFVGYLNKVGIYAILDLHCGAPGTYQACRNSFHMPDEDHAPSFWTSVASAFKTNPAVIFDLYNEPYLGGQTPSNVDWTCWLKGCADTTSGVVPYNTAGMQQLINIVRSTGATQPILVGSMIWAGDPCGLYDSQGVGGTCQITNPIYKPVDPINQLAIDFHNYGGVCNNTYCWNYTLHALQAAKIPWITTEFGEFDCTGNYMNTYMNWADQNNMSYLAWAWMTNDGPSGGYTSCVPGGSGNSNPENTELISKWDGTPSLISPQGANYRAHLLSVSPY